MLSQLISDTMKVWQVISVSHCHCYVLSLTYNSIPWSNQNRLLLGQPIRTSHFQLIPSYLSYSIFQIRASISLWFNLLIWFWLITLAMSSKSLAPTDFWTKPHSRSILRSMLLARMCTVQPILTLSMVEHFRLWVKSWISLHKIVVFFIRWVLSDYDFLQNW